MHPAFVTTDPRARCPDCGMKLVPVPAEAPAPGAAPAGPPVPGVTTVELSPDRVQLIGMRSVAASRQTLASSIRAVGFVAANESSLVSVNTRFSGWVEQLHVGQTGQLVQQGEVLASLYSPEMLNAQQVFLNAIKWTDRKPGGSAQAPAIANDLERDARLRLELLGVAPQDVDAIAEAGQPQRAMNVRSPVRGYVARKSVVRGLYVQSGTELFQLADLSTVWVLVDVYEAEIPRVKVGQQATFELKSYPGRKFVGKVQFIYPALNTGSRTLQARVELRNPGLELRPGMFGDVTLDLGAAEAVVIPQEALIDTGEHRYVFVDRGGGRYEPRPVEAGWSGEGRVAILSGLAAGEKVVTTANFLLDSESRLRAAVEGFNAAGGAQAGHDHARPVPEKAASPAGHAPGHGEHAMPMPERADPPAAPAPPRGDKAMPRPEAPPAGHPPGHGEQPMTAPSPAPDHVHAAPAHGDHAMPMPEKAAPPHPAPATPMPEAAPAAPPPTPKP